MFKYYSRRNKSVVVNNEDDTKQHKAVSEHNTLISNQAKTISHCCAAKDGKLCGAASYCQAASKGCDIQN